MHKGGPAKITGAMGDESSPIRTQVPGAAGARAAGCSTSCGEEDAVRDDVTPLQVARLVGGVATVADQSGLEAAAVRPMLEVVADGLLK